MINVLTQSRDFNEVEIYLMTINPGIVSAKDIPDGTSIEVDGVITFEDIKDDGEVSEIMSIITPSKEVYSCQSATFKRSLNDIATIMKDKKFSIVKTSGKTKAGRDYINCTLDISKI